jgi:predicted O-linked N-acetylglucosamine transferase (SPINDLY family)
VLWLHAWNDAMPDNLRREARARGVAGERLVFAPAMSLPEHLARHRVADLFLDTLHFNAHTTASVALWAGLPVLTCPGETFISRIGASLLAAVGLPELIARSPADYEARAYHLATHRDELAAIARKLHEHRSTFPLFDTPRFTRHLEAAYAGMWQRQRQGLPPRDIRVG